MKIYKYEKFNSKIKELNMVIENQKNIIFNLENEIRNLKSKFPFDIQPNDKLMTIMIQSFTDKFHFSIICKNSENLVRIEKEFLDEYPEYKNRNIFFLFNGSLVDKSKTLEENKIKNNSILILAFAE
jgi:hypothetical protein